MQRYDDAQLSAAYAAPRPPAVIDLAGPAAFAAAHLPHAVNVPAGPRFAERVGEVLPDRNTRIVLSAPPGSSLLDESAAALERAGYRAVAGYTGAVSQWRPAGDAIEGHAAKVGPDVVSSERLRRRPRPEAVEPGSPSLASRAARFASKVMGKRLISRLVPGWSAVTAARDIKKALDEGREEAPLGARIIAWGAAGASTIGATSVPFVGPLAAAAGAALSWLRDQGDDEDAAAAH